MNEISRPPAPPPQPETREKPRGKPFPRTAFLVLGAVLLLAIGWGAWGHYSTARRASQAQQAAQSFTPTLRAAEAKRDDKPVDLTLPGQTLPFDQARLYARATGYIAERHVDIGSRVHKGDLLVRVSAPDLDAQLQQAAAQLGQQQALINQAHATLDQSSANKTLAGVTDARTSTLAREGWETRQNADNSRANLQSQGANVEAATAGVKVAEANFQAQYATVQRLMELTRYEKVTAPFDGVVTSRNVDTGDLVSADANGGTALFTLQRDDVLRVQIYVPQSAAFGISEGLAATVKVPEMPGRSFTGRVARSSVAFDQSSRTLVTEVDVPNPDGTLHAGMYVDVSLAIPRTSPGVVVPSEAILFNAQGLHVAVVDQDTVRMQTVSIARDFGTSVELRDGLKGGEQVALAPPADLKDGEKVRLGK